jgi:hypothetical protein
MTTTIYRSTDASAPQMTSAAGSLITVLDAVLVDGYGAKPAAGWTKEVVDSGTKKVTYLQAAKAGAARKRLYIDDNVATGMAKAWACTSCTTSASPVFTEEFWSNSDSTQGAIHKADQDTHATDAAWIIVANSRSLLIATTRAAWSTGWVWTFIGDLVTPYPTDYGNFCVAGRTTSQNYADVSTPLTMSYAIDGIAAFGLVDGTEYRTSTNVASATAGTTDSTYPFNAPTVSKQGYTVEGADGCLCGVIFYQISSSRYRGHLPWIYNIGTTDQVLPVAAVPDLTELTIRSSLGAAYDITGILLTTGPSNNNKFLLQTSNWSV